MLVSQASHIMHMQTVDFELSTWMAENTFGNNLCLFSHPLHEFQVVQSNNSGDVIMLNPHDQLYTVLYIHVCTCILSVYNTNM